MDSTEGAFLLKYVAFRLPEMYVYDLHALSEFPPPALVFCAFCVFSVRCSDGHTQVVWRQWFSICCCELTHALRRQWI